MAKDYIISVDLGGTKILSAIINKEKQIIERTKVATDIKKGPDFLVESVVKSIEELLKKTGVTENQIKAIALGVPGTVNPQSGIISVAPNLKIENFNIKRKLKNISTFLCYWKMMLIWLRWELNILNIIIQS